MCQKNHKTPEKKNKQQKYQQLLHRLYIYIHIHRIHIY